MRFEKLKKAAVQLSYTSATGFRSQAAYKLNPNTPHLTADDVLLDALSEIARALYLAGRRDSVESAIKQVEFEVYKFLSERDNAA